MVRPPRQRPIGAAAAAEPPATPTVVEVLPGVTAPVAPVSSPSPTHPARRAEARKRARSEETRIGAFILSLAGGNTPRAPDLRTEGAKMRRDWKEAAVWDRSAPSCCT